MADTDKLKTDNSDLQTGKWGTGLLKSYLDERGDLFTKMSDTMCKELEKQLYSSDEVNLFKDELDNKKKLTSSIKISNKNTIIADKIDYLDDDLDSLFYNDHKEKEPIDKDKIMESVGLDEASNNDTANVQQKLQKFEAEPEDTDIKIGQTAESIGGGWFDTFKKKFGEQFKENSTKVFMDFLSKGPGGAQGFDLFRGIGKAFKATWDLNRDSVLKIGKLYDTNPAFKKWYDTIYDIATKGNKSDVIAGIQGVVNNTIVDKENTDNTQQEENTNLPTKDLDNKTPIKWVKDKNGEYYYQSNMSINNQDNAYIYWHKDDYDGNYKRYTKDSNGGYHIVDTSANQNNNSNGTEGSVVFENLLRNIQSVILAAENDNNNNDEPNTINTGEQKVETPQDKKQEDNKNEQPNNSTTKQPNPEVDKYVLGDITSVNQFKALVNILNLIAGTNSTIKKDINDELVKANVGNTTLISNLLNDITNDNNRYGYNPKMDEYTIQSVLTYKDLDKGSELTKQIATTLFLLKIAITCYNSYNNSYGNNENGQETTDVEKLFTSMGNNGNTAILTDLSKLKVNGIVFGNNNGKLTFKTNSDEYEFTKPLNELGEEFANNKSNDNGYMQKFIKMISEHITKKTTTFDANTVSDIFTNLAIFVNKGEYKGIIKNNTTASTNP